MKEYNIRFVVYTTIIELPKKKRNWKPRVRRRYSLFHWFTTQLHKSLQLFRSVFSAMAFISSYIHQNRKNIDENPFDYKVILTSALHSAHP